jgi:hypothetical protein
VASGVIPAKLQAARVRYTITISLGSFLLFLVQPMVARMALPRLGGAPAVWNSAMLVYQTLLLAGYAYAHWLGSLVPRRQAVIQLVFLAVAAVTLPIGLRDAAPPPDANPIVWVPWLLLSSVGPLFFVVSAQAPLIQRWAAAAGVKDPYPLYAASNLGSFTGLLCYPFLVEPLLPVSQQRWLWTTGYLLLGIAAAWSIRGLPRGGGSRENAGAPAVRNLVRWALIASVPSGLILSTTLYLTTDLFAMPLLWVVPLSIYLLSFPFAFQPTRPVVRVIIALAPLLIVVAAVTLFASDSPLLHLASAALSLLMFFSVSVALHHQLYEQRPRAGQLTWFYLALATGGAIGGFFCAIIAPLAFDWLFEHPILIVAAAALITVPNPFRRLVDLWNGDRNAELFTIGGLAAVPAIVALGLMFNPTVAALALLSLALIAIGNRALFSACVTGLLLTTGGWQTIAPGADANRHFRSFFGIYTISDAPGEREIAHGATRHGLQNLGSEQRERMTTSYYAPRSGVGLGLLTANQVLGGARRIDVVGLGAGTLACYARPGQAWTFYEIDPLVIHIAKEKFTFLKRCLPGVPIVVGDARLSLAKAHPAGADILIIDAFSSEAIPMHLLTREAFNVYRRRLRSDGLLLVHISNRFLDLQPVLSAESAQGGWAAAVCWYHPTLGELSQNYAPSEWVALSPSRLTIDRLRLASKDGWLSLPKQHLAEWTDDHASLLPIIRW